MLKDILKDKNASLLGLVTLALFVILVIYLLNQDASLVGPL
ncbi:MAG: hypothetical protein WCG16_00500 [Methylococcales bacterium]|jgi:hypothetical protein